ncbi:hypothetical protein [Rhodoferax antarcticus]|uniref:Uncharacterized protein n=1 Tax=Rhodoferax antarcticus ANT.BR TaxID=1111071 RepID=A0A1Q8Y9E9_9BURK|nr:hypothetical protein [Rhodoferax antarcticus]OLP04567.1 hypothetical protein BLL52_4223 [Rhodoferax antarcticus ANT.BR]
MADSDITEIIEGCQTIASAVESVANEFGLETKSLTGYIVTTQDTDGTDRQSFETFDLALTRFVDMAGKPPLRCTDDRLLSGETFNVVSDYGNVVTLSHAN